MLRYDTNKEETFIKRGYLRSKNIYREGICKKWKLTQRGKMGIHTEMIDIRSRDI